MTKKTSELSGALGTSAGRKSKPLPNASSMLAKLTTGLLSSAVPPHPISQRINWCEEFEKLNKLLANNISKQARCLFIKTLISLQGLQTEAIERERVAKKMNATNAQALNTFRQRIRKIYRDHQEEIKRFQQDPTTFESLSEDEPDSQAPKEFSAHDSGMTAPATAREKQGFISVRRSLRMTNATTGGIFKTLKFFSLARGKKFTDRTEQVKVLEELKTVAVTPYQKIHVLLALISSRLDYHSMSLIMPTEQWTAYPFPAADLTLTVVLEMNCFYFLLFWRRTDNGLWLKMGKIFRMMVLGLSLNRIKSLRSMAPSFPLLIDLTLNSPKHCRISIRIRQSTSTDFVTNNVCTLSLSEEESGLNVLRVGGSILVEAQVASS